MQLATGLRGDGRKRPAPHRGVNLVTRCEMPAGYPWAARHFCCINAREPNDAFGRKNWRGLPILSGRPIVVSAHEVSSL